IGLLTGVAAAAQDRRPAHAYDLSKPDPEAVRILGVAWLRVAAATRRRGRRRHDAPGDLPARARAEPLERRVRAACAPARRRPVRRKPAASVRAPPVSCNTQACVGRSEETLF